jgi:hypothetical protein
VSCCRSCIYDVTVVAVLSATRRIVVDPGGAALTGDVLGGDVLGGDALGGKAARSGEDSAVLVLSPASGS